MTAISRSDEIGNHARLKIVCRKAWEFKSPLRHYKKITRYRVIFLIYFAIKTCDTASPFSVTNLFTLELNL